MVTKPDPKRPYKAIVAGVVTAGTWATAALADGTVSGQEWIAGIVGVVVVVAGVFGVSNPQVPE